MDLVQCSSIIRKYIGPEQRLIICIFGFLAVANAFVMQHSLEVILKELPKQKSKKFRINYKDQEIFKEKPIEYFKRLVKNAYKNDSIKHVNYSSYLTNTTVPLPSIAMISFYIGYAIAQIPGSLLSERFGGKRILATSLLLTALLSFITPYIIAYCHILGLIVLCIAMGFSEGPIFPALTVMIAHRIPQCQRATFSSVILSAGNLGILITNLFSGYITSQYDWPKLFYFVGICCLLWLVCFIVFCDNSSEGISNMNEIESNEHLQLCKSHISLNRIESASSLSLSGNVDTISIYKKTTCTPWKDIFTNSSVWALIMANVQYDWSKLILKCDVNDIMKKWNEMDIQESFSTRCKIAIPFIINWLMSILTGLLSDILVNNNVLNTTEVRKIMTMLAAFGPKICSNFASCVLQSEHCDPLTLLNCAISTMGPYYAGSMINAIDLSPNYAGTLMAIANLFGCLLNIVAPFLEEILRQPGFIQNLRSVIWLLCTMFTSGDVQSFNGPIILFQTM